MGNKKISGFVEKTVLADEDLFEVLDPAESLDVDKNKKIKGSTLRPATTAANDFQVGNGSGAWIKKTLAQTKTILVLAGLSELGAKFEYVDATVSATSDTYAAKTGGPDVTVVVPASGSILVILAADMWSDTTNAFAIMTVHDGSGNKDSLIRLTLNAGNDEILSQGRTKIGLLTGYTPGASITLTARYARADGGTASFQKRALFAIPW